MCDEVTRGTAVESRLLSRVLICGAHDRLLSAY